MLMISDDFIDVEVGSREVADSTSFPFKERLTVPPSEEAASFSLLVPPNSNAGPRVGRSLRLRRRGLVRPSPCRVAKTAIQIGLAPAFTRRARVNQISIFVSSSFSAPLPSTSLFISFTFAHTALLPVLTSILAALFLALSSPRTSQSEQIQPSGKPFRRAAKYRGFEDRSTTLSWLAEFHIIKVHRQFLFERSCALNL